MSTRDLTGEGEWWEFVPDDEYLLAVHNALISRAAYELAKHFEACRTFGLRAKRVIDPSSPLHYSVTQASGADDDHT